jgi:hypothetical protein
MTARLTRGWLAASLAVACAVSVAACGGSSPKKTNRSGRVDASMLAHSECMRAHGVTNFPDPGGGGGGDINLSGTGINVASPAFRAAQSACFHLLPGGGPNGHKLSKQQIAAMVATSQCMRQHGVTGFPDPYAVSGNALPNLNPADYSSIQMGGGEVLAIPKSINENSPAFQQAAKTCHFS